METMFRLPESVSELTVDTGNLIKFTDFKRKTSQSPTEELVESVLCTLTDWTKIIDVNSLQEQEKVVCRNDAHTTPVGKEERKDLKLTVKIFLGRFDCEALKAAVQEVMSSLGISTMDSLILQCPSLPNMGKLTLEQIQPLWQVMEEMVRNEKVVTIGMSDLDSSQLEQLYDWAEIKPTVNQVNLDSCCVMPPEMTSFAREHDIQLLTHSDPKVMLPDESFQMLLSPLSLSSENWMPYWIGRYLVMVKTRGIIQNKGYIFATKKISPALFNGI